MSFKNYEDTRQRVQNSPWFKDLTRPDYPSAELDKLVKLSRFRFEEELQVIIDRHDRQQTTIDQMKKSCHIKP